MEEVKGLLDDFSLLDLKEKKLYLRFFKLASLSFLAILALSTLYFFLGIYIIPLELFLISGLYHFFYEKILLKKLLFSLFICGLWSCWLFIGYSFYEILHFKSMSITFFLEQSLSIIIFSGIWGFLPGLFLGLIMHLCFKSQSSRLNLFLAFLIILAVFIYINVNN